MTDRWDNEIIPDPNWEDHIQYFFSDGDVQCMSARAMPLDDYDTVRRRARQIYGATKAKTMPLGDPSRLWNENRLGTFKNWIANGQPFNAEENSRLDRIRIDLTNDDSLRVRKNLNDIAPDSEEMQLLKKAFRGIMDKDPSEPNSYFSLAGLHWFPYPATYCVHNEDRYNPWHRLYLIAFENALRSIPECENVTLPYWDIGSGEIPDVLFEEPFDKYVYQTQVTSDEGIAKELGDETRRNSKEEILQVINNPGYRIKENIDLALKAETWHGFNGLPPSSNNIIQAHNSGHFACGPTLQTPDTAAFDPIFWFFHCNWDRLWWQWQRNAEVQNLNAFREFMERNRENTEWLDDDVVGLLEPFGMISNGTIDSLDSLKVDYELPEPIEGVELFNIWRPMMAATGGARVPQTEKVQVRLEGLNRLLIDGGILIELEADSAVIGAHYVFQSTKPKDCQTCIKRGLFDIDFELDRSLIWGKRLGVKVTRVDRDGMRNNVALEDCGSPTLSVRLPLDI